MIDGLIFFQHEFLIKDLLGRFALIQDFPVGKCPVIWDIRFAKQIVHVYITRQGNRSLVIPSLHIFWFESSGISRIDLSCFEDFG